MGSLFKQSLSGNIHKIREFELEKVNLAEEFDILQIVGEGWFGKILLVEHKATDTEMVLKALPKPYTALKDFYREFHYGLHLGIHRNIITAYDVAFETAGFYVFSQEYAPLGDLTSNVSEIGIGELHTKRVAKQLSAALEHMHARDLVHRDVKLDNILVFKSDFSRIKLCDFGETRRVGSIVLRRNEWLPYAAPEVLQVATDGSYMAATSHDVWQFGIVIFVCLTGCLPWQKAAMDDPRYIRYLSWQNSNIPLKRQPKLFKLVSSKAQRLFKKYLEPRPDKRPSSLGEVHRYLDDRWMSKGMEKSNETLKEDEGLCPSMYSFHSSPEEKNKLLFTLTQYGLETTVDRVAKKDRIRDWIQNSVIEEDDEVEEVDEENIKILDDESDPVGERAPLSERKLKNEHLKPHNAVKRERRISMAKKDTVYKPPIDPRIPLQDQKALTTEKEKAKSSSSEEKKDKPEDRRPSHAGGIAQSLPFVLKLSNSLTSSESAFSSDSSITVKHKINVQIPQSALVSSNGLSKDRHARYK
nr:serine/threonine-protein kinase SBK1-like [Leptinotarsa decemlineata]XP_023014919.1 serine/threonine-protein kinase SBK1-like [Leptinotarsa decemlineata]XP_023014920.1 serine/threonine-protein kinase SBK1-like [Leptinotarsa decemlineata]